MQQDDEKIGLYPIRSVSSMTQVQAVTLRAWERRYGLLKPTRTEKGHRLYSQKDIETIKKIKELAAKGIAISQIAALLTPMTATELGQSWPSFWQKIQAAAWRFDLALLEQLYQKQLAQESFFAMLEHFFLPALEGKQREPLAENPLVLAFFDNFLRSKLLEKWLSIEKGQGGQLWLSLIFPGVINELRFLLLSFQVLSASQHLRCIAVPGYPVLRGIEEAFKQSQAQGILLISDKLPEDAFWQKRLYKLAENLPVVVFLSEYPRQGLKRSAVHYLPENIPAAANDLLVLTKESSHRG
jgi:DNA-binding transcriptional MerR regulator